MDPFTIAGYVLVTAFAVLCAMGLCAIAYLFYKDFVR